MRRRRSPLGPYLEGRYGRLALLSGVSFAAGICEALFLATITRVAFSITNDDKSVMINLAALGRHEYGIPSVLYGAALFVLLRVALSIWSASLSTSLVTSAVADERKRLAAAYLSASWSAQSQDRPGSLQELLTTSTERLGEVLLYVATAIAISCNLLALFLGAFALSPVAALGIFAAVAVLSLCLRPLRSALRRQSRGNAQTNLTFATTLNDVSQLGQEIHVFRTQAGVASKLASIVDENATARWRSTFLSTLVQPLYLGIAFLSLTGALALVYRSGTNQLAQLGAVTLLMLRALSYGQFLQTATARIKSSEAFLEDLQSKFEFYRLNAITSAGAAVTSVGTLAFDHVNFAYDAARPVLKDMTFEISPCEVVGIIGPSGSGKSTLVQLLLRLREADNGCVLSDGRDVRTLDRDEWARRVTFVPQDAQLFTGTIADNIRFFREHITDDALMDAAKLAHIHEDICSWSLGYDLVLGDQGNRMSGGQRQRLCIARALVEQPDVIILDEPSSALDVHSEVLLRDTLASLGARMSVVIVAHRLSTLEICDRIMVIQDGVLRAYDTPERLERAGGFYREALTLAGLR